MVSLELSELEIKMLTNLINGGLSDIKTQYSPLSYDDKNHYISLRGLQSKLEACLEISLIESSKLENRKNLSEPNQSQTQIRVSDNVSELLNSGINPTEPSNTSSEVTERIIEDSTEDGSKRVIKERNFTVK